MTLRAMRQQLRGSTIEVLRAGASDREAVFVHANGFPPAAYRPFLETLGETMTVDAVPLRPLWSKDAPEPDLRWADLGDDLIELLDSTKGPPVLLIGHSMGATVGIYAVAARPDLFRGLVVIEPAMVRPWQAVALRWSPWALKRRVEPIAGAVRKRDRWPTRAAFLESCRRSGLYDRLSESALEAFADAALVVDGDGVTLAYPKRWEAWGYATAPSPIAALRTIEVPIVGLRGRSSVFLDDTRWAACVAAAPRGTYEQLPKFGHLLPLEAPAQTARAVLDAVEPDANRRRAGS